MVRAFSAIVKHTILVIIIVQLLIEYFSCIGVRLYLRRTYYIQDKKMRIITFVKKLDYRAVMKK